uniref:Uncharacterized protein n=2 Tax=Clastoptera arizonana TaxID=38151 RepID=A0A1B6CE07_9HEMI
MHQKKLISGIAITNGNINGPHVESLYVLSTNYVKPSFEESIEFKDTYGDLLLHKLDREITYHLSKTIKMKINTALTKPIKLSRQEVDTQTQVLIKNYQIDLISNGNNLVDNVLKFVADFVQGQFQDKFPLPNLNERFSVNVIIIPVNGGFVANKGIAKGIKTIYRNGNVVLGTGNDSLLHFYGGLGFKNLKVRFNYYRAEVLGIGPTGMIDVQLAPLNILLYVRVNTSGPSINLEYFRIMNVGGVRLNLTGLGSQLNWLVSMATTWIFGLYRDRIIRILEKRVTEVLNKTLLEGSIDDLLNG